MTLVPKVSSNLNELLYLIESLITHAFVECSNVHVKAVFACACVFCLYFHISGLSK